MSAEFDKLLPSLVNSGVEFILLGGVERVHQEGAPSPIDVEAASLSFP
jgi:hypothetical protein